MQTAFNTYEILNALDEAVCIFEQLSLRSDNLRDYKYVFVNEAFKSLFGTADVAGQSVRDNFPDEPESWYDDYDEVLATGFPKRFTREAPSQHMIIEMYVSRVEDGTGKRLINTMRNVTATKEIEAALLKSEAKLQESEMNMRMLIAQSPVAMALLSGPEFIVEIVNDSFITIWGKDDSVRGKRIIDALPEMKDQPYPDILKKVYQTGEAYYGESAEVQLMRNGTLETCYFNFVNQPYRKADGTITGIIVVANEVTDQVKANHGLSQTLERVRLAQEAAQFGIYDFNLATGQLEWDHRCRELFGIFNDYPITYEEHFLGGLHPDDRERLATIVTDTLDRAKTGGAYDTEYRTIGREDGIERWVRAIGQAYFDDDDKPLRFLGAVIDITDIKRYQDALEKNIGQLRHSEAKFRNLVEQAPVSIAIYTGDDLIVEMANKNMLTLWGKDFSVIGLSLQEALPELTSENQPFLQILANVRRTGERYTGLEERAVLLKMGELKEGFYDYIFEPIKDHNDDTYAIMQVAIDVTQQVQSRLELQRTEEMLRLSVKAASAALWSMDVNTGEFIVSNEFYSMYGLAPNTPPAVEAILARIPEEYHTKIKVGLAKAISSGEGYRMEHPAKTDAGIRWLRAEGKVHAATPIRPESFSGLTIDITEQKHDEQRKNDFIGMVSHELKTPLTSLSAIVQLLRSKFKNNDDAFLNGAADRASRQVGRMTAMINGFLNVSRLESGKLLINKEDFDLEELLEEVVNEMRLIDPGHTILFERHAPVSITADREKINSVVSNLLSNAVKYSPKGSTVTLTCFNDGRHVKVSIYDEGIGIKEEDQKRLFDRYYRVDNPNTRTISGFGIGLYLSSEIIKMHGGQMSVHSEQGQGSTFSFILPSK